MSILFTGRKAHLTDDLRELAEHKLSKLERILRESPDAHVILTQERHRHVAEVIVKARLGVLTARGDAPDFTTSLAQATERLLAQARRLHEKIATARKRRARRASRRGGPDGGAPEAGRDGAAEAVVALERIALRRMSVEEAIEQMERRRDSFLMFRNADSRRVSVVFRREDGRFGLIEPEA